MPQGTVSGPKLFLLHISSIAKEVSPQSTVSSYVDDTRVTRSINNPAQDCVAMQQDLQAIYRWAEEVNMVFNGDKFEMLHFWPVNKPRPEHFYSDQGGVPIEEKQHLRDLGVKVSSDLTFNIHNENVVLSSTRMVGWVLRTFKRRSRMTMLCGSH